MGSKTELMLERENERTEEDGKTRGTSMIGQESKSHVTWEIYLGKHSDRDTSHTTTL
jgi:hypothetical protein